MRAIQPSDPAVPDDPPQESVRGLLRHAWVYSLAPVIQRLLAIEIGRAHV